MSTWEETRNYIRGRYRLLRDEPDWLGLECNVHDAGEPATLRLKLERVTAFSEPWLLLRCAICDEGALDVRSALHYNSDLAVGALALEAGRCYLRAALPLETLTWPHLDRCLAFLAEEATKLRQVHVANHASATVFKEWAD